ncbi:MAG: thrombospondin type 3 repeat-containing protein [Pontiella sp.]
MNTADASIDDVGLLRVGSLSSDQNISITASVGGYSETLDVLIQSVAPVLTGIEIFGPSTVDEEGSAQYACTAYYLDETTGSVVPSWTVSSDVAVIDASGTLTVGRIESDELIRIVASFDGETNSFEVTLRVTADDETSNGTPYSWLLEYGLTEADDHLDTDGDGLLTWEEYIAGTNPTNAASVLIITSNQRLDNGDYVVTWQSVEGKSYSVITNTSLSDPTTGTVASDILGEVNETSYTGTMGSAEAVFYEIGVE